MAKNASNLTVSFLLLSLFLSVSVQAAPFDSTEDPVLEDQIKKVSQTLEGVNHQMAQLRKASQEATEDAAKASLDAEIEGLRAERDKLETLLHDLVDEAKPADSTEIDKALQQVQNIETRQERTNERQEALRDRQGRN